EVTCSYRIRGGSSAPTGSGQRRHWLSTRRSRSSSSAKERDGCEPNTARSTHCPQGTPGWCRTRRANSNSTATSPSCAAARPRPPPEQALDDAHRLGETSPPRPTDRAGAVGPENPVGSAAVHASARERSDLDQQRVALAATAAQRRRTEPTAPTTQLVHQVHHEPSTGRPDGVSQRDRPAVDVDPLLVEAEFAHRH